MFGTEAELLKVLAEAEEALAKGEDGALEKFESSFVFEAEASTPGGLPLRRSPRKLKRPANPVARALLRVARLDGTASDARSTRRRGRSSCCSRARRGLSLIHI